MPNIQYWFQSLKVILDDFSFEFRDSGFPFPGYHCALRCVALWLRTCRPGRPDFICQRDTREESECKTLISPDPDEGSLLSQREALLGSPAWRGAHCTSGDGAHVRATRVQVSCLLLCLQMQMRQKKRSCWEPSWLTSTQSAACICSINACDSTVKGPGTLMGCLREIVDQLLAFVLSYKEKDYFLDREANSL